jgi:hypothetical protein
MVPKSRRELLLSLLALPAALRGEDGWIPLFDGRTLDGWKANESGGSFRVVDGQIAVDGPRSHLHKAIAADYDRLWTPERMQKVIDAAKRNDVAIKINNTYRLPSPAFIKTAKKAGIKFSFGTNNGDRKLGRIEY